MFKRITQLWIIFCMVFFATAAHAQIALSPIPAKIRCAYVVYPPYFNKDPNTGALSGPVYDLVNQIAGQMNIPVLWQEEVSWSTMLTGLESNRYDAVCSGIWSNAARAPHALFSQPIFYNAVNLYGRTDAKSLPSINAYNHSGARFATVDGEISDILVRELFPKASRLDLPPNTAVADLLENIVTRKADYSLQDMLVAQQFSAHNPNRIKPLLAKPLRVFPVTLAFSQSSIALWQAFDTAIAEAIRTDRVKQALLKNQINLDAIQLPNTP